MNVSASPLLGIGTDRRAERRRVFGLLLLVAVLHAPSLVNPFFIDDYVYLDTVHDLNPSRVADIFTSSTMGAEASSVWWTPIGALPFYRPIGEMTFALDYAVWGLHPVGYHLTNLLLHLLCVFLTWRLVRRLTDRADVALAAAAVFALHPVHTEAVAWISGRFDLLVCAATLSGTLAFLNWQDAPRRGWGWGIAALGAFAVGLGVKETAVILPALLLVGELLRWRGRDAPRHPARLTVAALAFGVVGAGYLTIRFALFDGLGTLPPPYGLDGASPVEAIRAVAWNLCLYLLDFVLWIQVDAIYLSDFWARHVVVFGLLVAFSLVVLVACARVARRQPGVRLGFVWVVLFTAPSLMAMPGERNVYLASVGMGLVFGIALVALARKAGERGMSAASLRRRVVGVGALVAVVVVTEQVTMWVVASTGDKVIRDVIALAPTPPPGARIYVVNQCPLNAVGFEQALKLRLGREDIRACALSLSPTLERSTVDTVERLGDHTLGIRRRGGRFFQSFVERFHLFSRESASDLVLAARRVGMTLTNPPADIRSVDELDLRLPLPLDDPRVLLFTWNNDAVHGRVDYPFLPRLTRIEPVRLDHRRARAGSP